MKSEYRRLAKASLIYGGGAAVNRFMSFLLLPVFTAYLTPADYGVSSILGFIAFFVYPVFSLGFGTAIGLCYFDSKETRYREAVIWTSLIILVASTLFMIIGASLFDTWISQISFQSAAYNRLIVISIIGTGASIATIPLGLSLQLEDKAFSYAFASIVGSTASIGLMILFVVGLSRGIVGLVEATALGQVITVLVFAFFVLPRIPYKFSSAIMKKLLRVGLPVIPGFAFVFILQYGNRYILQYIGSLDVVGIYTVGFNIGMPMGMAVGAFQSAWTPFFLSFVDKQNEARALFGKLFTYYVLGFGFLTLLFFLGAKPVVLLMTQPPFYSAFIVVGCSALAQFFIGVYSMLLPGAYFNKETHIVTSLQAGAAIISIMSNIIFIRVFGLIGAGIGLALGVSAMPIFLHWWNRRQRGRYLEIEFDKKRIVLFGLFMTLVIVCSFIPRSFSTLVEFLVSGAATIIAAIIVFLFLTTEERTAGLAIVQQYLTFRKTHAN
jgi:O-antigen/teichoic acid export membrane protein